MSEGMVFVQTNEAENAVVAYRRAEDGSLAEAGRVATGGSGEGQPHLQSQGSVTLTGDGRYLLVTNSGTGDVTVVEASNLTVVGSAPAGTTPRSVAEHRGVVYVLSVGTAAVLGFRLGDDGGLTPIGEQGLSDPAADPAQVGFSPDGSSVIVTERGTNAITSFTVGADGTLSDRRTIPSSGPTPYGFDFTRGGVLVVTEAFGAQKGAAATSSYAVAAGTVVPVSKSVGNGRSEICWAVVTDDGRWAFTTNFADGAVSAYRIDGDGNLILEDSTAGITEDGRPGLRDEALAGGFLYALDADSGSIFGWAVGSDGSLTLVGSWGGLPVTAGGLAAS